MDKDLPIGQPLWFSTMQKYLPDADPRDPVDLAVYRIWADVTSRKGWDALWDEFDNEVRAEIFTTWRNILRIKERG